MSAFVTLPCPGGAAYVPAVCMCKAVTVTVNAGKRQPLTDRQVRRVLLARISQPIRCPSAANNQIAPEVQRLGSCRRELTAQCAVPQHVQCCAQSCFTSSAQAHTASRGKQTGRAGQEQGKSASWPRRPTSSSPQHAAPTTPAWRRRQEPRGGSQSANLHTVASWRRKPASCTACDFSEGASATGAPGVQRCRGATACSAHSTGRASMCSCQ